MASEVLIVGHPNPRAVKFGADFVEQISEVKKFDYSVIVLPVDSLKSTTLTIEKMKAQMPHGQFILIKNKITTDDIKYLRDKKIHNYQLSHYDKEFLEPAIKNALNRFYELSQNISLFEHSAESEKKEKSKQRSQKRFLQINTQIESLHRALVAVHSAQSITEIESQLFSALSSYLNLAWVRIFLFSNDHLENQLSRVQGQKLYKAPLRIDARALGQLVVARLNNKEFTKNEKESLDQITESVALALDRLAKLEQAETLHLQWESTFDAITEPLCLTDEQFRIIRTNKAFLDTIQVAAPKAAGLNCFKLFCEQNEPTQVQQSEHSLILQRIDRNKNEPEFYEVSTQRIRMPSNPQPILLVLFRNITEQKKIEKQIFESSKMAELGTISSSIAHDINNPLGGMLNFIQLLKMDIRNGHAFYDDLLAMEVAGIRCKEIVENLLKFSRRHELIVAEKLDLADAIHQALSVVELQARPLGIKIEVLAPSEKLLIIGHLNLMAQALSHIIQNAFDAVSEKLVNSPGYNGLIKIEALKSSTSLTLSIFDNGIGISPENQNKILNPLFSTKNKKQGLGLTLAYQIIADHGGRLDIFSQPNVGTTVKISFQNV